MTDDLIALAEHLERQQCGLMTRQARAVRDLLAERDALRAELELMNRGLDAELTKGRDDVR